MNIPQADVDLAFTYGYQFNVLQKNGRGKPWQTVFEDIPSLSEAMEKVTIIDAWETGVFTMEGTLYWSSLTPEVFNSTIIE
ncbi:MAG: hypothetical protein AAF490_04355 [Chloroflexota bacterium]